jgi:hypothetical protein
LLSPIYHSSAKSDSGFFDGEKKITVAPFANEHLLTSPGHSRVTASRMAGIPIGIVNQYIDRTLCLAGEGKRYAVGRPHGLKGLPVKHSNRFHRWQVFPGFCSF